MKISEMIAKCNDNVKIGKVEAYEWCLENGFDKLPIKNKVHLLDHGTLKGLEFLWKDQDGEFILSKHYGILDFQALRGGN